MIITSMASRTADYLNHYQDEAIKAERMNHYVSVMGEIYTIQAQLEQLPVKAMRKVK